MTPTVLHVGAHKTATTHLQRSIMAVRPELVARGVQFYAPTMLRRDGQSLLSRLEADDVRAALWRGGQRLVISEENFIGTLYVRDGVIPKPLYRYGPERIAQLAEKLAPDGLDVFLCVRDPAQFLTSAFSQVLMGGLVMPAETFRDTNPIEKVDWVYLARRIARTPGVRRLTVWRYEDYAGVFDQICTEMLGFAGAVQPVEGVVHRGLSAKAVAAMTDWHLAGETGPLAVLARETHPVSDVAPAVVAYPDQAASAEMYSTQLAKIARIPNARILVPDT